MPDTKRGRERQGAKKREQLEHHLARRELNADESDEPEYPPADAESELLTEPSTLDE
ncbi:hypothetical protein [Halobaculum sp. D14]|uniref:hypothetical protein n=1 Tax=unclassified Halobaculum TaxID=2640896 RepID=UPI003EBD4CC3